MFGPPPSPPDPAQPRKRLRWPFLVTAAVILTSMVATYFMGIAVIRGHEEIITRHADVDRVRTVLQALIDAETGQRGYLLSQNESYLAPYTAAKARIDGEISALSGFAPLQIRELDNLAAIKLAELAESLAAYKGQGMPAALKIVNSNEGQQSMAAIRRLTSQMINAASTDIDRRVHAVDLLGWYRTALAALSGLLCLTFLAWAHRRIRSEMERTSALAWLHQHHQKILSVALTSIGDAVIMTDQEGRITLINKVAEDLTGWTSDEALGQDCTNVFKIINERSRQIVESPVDKVLRTGAIVGLANHTLLIRKDGTEVSIDDSGAPIRDDAGQIYGVVLVFRDFSEHRRSETNLMKAMEEAEAANIAKDNFLATLSHELRTPLTPVVVTLTNWETDPALPPHLLADIQLMRRNLELEARLIDDLLDLTRIVKGKLPLNFEVADVHQLLGTVTEMYQSEISAKNLRVTHHFTAPEHLAQVDTARLQQVFWNILKNATKFSPEGGHIDIATVNRGDTIEINFRDEGIGMSPEMLGRLFRPFEQGAEETVRRYGGLGLGMAISKALIEAQHGGIAARSEGPGLGSTFVVTLPCSHQSQTLTPSLRHRSSDSRKLIIMLVEDHADTASAMTRLLVNRGHQVQCASTVAAAKALIDSHTFDLLLCDVGLPDGTGIELVAYLRTKSQIPAIALTGFGMEDDVKQCLQAGFNSHLTKPLNLQRLFEEIERLTKG